MTRQNDLFVLNGTGTGYGNFVFWGNVDYLDYPYTLQKGKRYILSLTVVSGEAEGPYTYRFSASDMDGGNRATVTATAILSSDKCINFVKIDTNQGAVFNNFAVKLQLEEGDTATVYEPHRGSIATINQPLRGIPDGSGGWAARDYIEVKDGAVRLVRECGEIAFDGTERWFALAVYLPGSDGVYYTNDLTDALYAPNVWCICTHFAGRKSGSAASYGAGSAWLQSTSAYPRIFLGTEIDDINDFKVWLAARHAAGTPVKVVYALETPQITDITATDLGQTLLSMKSVQYYTRIYHTSLLPVELEAAVTKLGSAVIS